MIAVRVAARFALAQDIVGFDLVAEGGGPLPAFRGGDHIDLWRGPDDLRQYSLAGDPADTDRYRIGVRRSGQGRVSDWLHDQVRPGTQLTVSLPRSSFPVEWSAPAHLLIAGGIGITPFLSMIPELARAGADWRLIYFTRDPARTAYLSELLASHYAERIDIRHSGGEPGNRPRLEAVVDSAAVGTHVYGCGPAGMIAALRDHAAARPAIALHVESFQPAAPVSGDRPFRIRLARDGRCLTVPVGSTMLSVLRTAGIAVPSTCKVGACGTCIVDVLAGVPDHRDSVLDPAERAAHRLITVCCSRSLSDEITLDL